MLVTKIYQGNEVNSIVDNISKMRINEFRNFPYMYDGSLEYERLYFQEFCKDPNSLIVCIFDDSKLIATATSIPLLSNADILDNVASKFIAQSLDPKTFFYSGEFIVLQKYRQNGLCKNLLYSVESLAKTLGFTNLCIATVCRSKDDPRRPVSYVDSDVVWKSLGFEITNIKTSYPWPTIQPNQLTVTVNNEMIFWTKEMGRS